MNGNIMTIITLGNKQFIPNLLGVPQHSILSTLAHNVGSWYAEVTINGNHTGLTLSELWIPINLSKRQLRKAANVLRAIGVSTAEVESLLFNKRAEQADRILRRFPKPEYDGTLYSEHAKRYRLINKTYAHIGLMQKVGFQMLPEGTFFGHQPKEYDRYLVAPL